ncbi:MAG: gfo/Idh/MocA family oxidoreductase, partial [Pirellulaceae bacterium]|nr:gfo/Idh/MocA family oxidoreductase [Pirellulaceae bacterium]
KRGGHQEEHHDLFAALRRGERPNEGDYGAKSTMTSIFGRLATYSGKKLLWKDAIESKIGLADVDAYADFSDTPPLLPRADGTYEVPIPGRTKAV